MTGGALLWTGSAVRMIPRCRDDRGQNRDMRRRDVLPFYPWGTSPGNLHERRDEPGPGACHGTLFCKGASTRKGPVVCGRLQLPKQNLADAALSPRLQIPKQPQGQPSCPLAFRPGQTATVGGRGAKMGQEDLHAKAIAAAMPLSSFPNRLGPGCWAACRCDPARSASSGRPAIGGTHLEKGSKRRHGAVVVFRKLATKSRS